MELWREWCALLIEYDIPGGPVATVDMALNNPQVLSQKMVIEMEHPLGGTIKLAGNPIKMEKGKSEETFLPPPTLAQQTDQILRDFLGYSDERIDALRQEQVVF